MRFDIEGFIIFDTEEASLVNLLTGDCIELSATSTRLLANLLQHRGDIVSRLDIFQSVFEEYGARASNSNLNQYVSTLRRSLSDLGLEKDVIVTVPRIGFKISDEVIITTDSDGHSLFTLTVVNQNPAKNRFIGLNRKFYLFSLLLFMSILFVIYLCVYKIQPAEQAIMQDKCSIYIPDSMSKTEVYNDINKIKKLPAVIDCSTPKKIYYLKRQINGTNGLGVYINTFILECGFKNNQCHSYYYREITNE